MKAVLTVWASVAGGLAAWAGLILLARFAAESAGVSQPAAGIIAVMSGTVAALFLGSLLGAWLLDRDG